MSVKRTEEFMYFQSKAKHYDNIKKIKPSINTFRNSMHSSRPRPHSLLRQYEQMKTNESLVNNILLIRNSQKSRLEVQGSYSRYNNFESPRISRYGTFKEQERHKSIEQQNTTLGYKILKVKPSIGTIADWNANFANQRSRRKIASKLNDKNNISIYSKNKFVPQHYQSFMERDGSTVAMRQKIFELPKIIAENHKVNKTIENNREQNEIKRIIKDTSGEFRYSD